jgi:hypothetical protein
MDYLDNLIWGPEVTLVLLLVSFLIMWLVVALLFPKSFFGEKLMEVCGWLWDAFRFV